MRIFVYESITGGGTFHASPCASPRGSLLAEGRAMLTAAASDFAELNDTDVICMWDKRLPKPEIADVEFVAVGSAEAEPRLFDHCAATSDFTLVVAPELNGELLSRARQVERWGGRLLSPDSDFVRLTASKYDTVSHLARAGVRVPTTYLYDDSSPEIDLSFPLVVKPNDGAGSIGVRLLERLPIASDLRRTDLQHPICVQQYCAGRAASVIVLCEKHRPTLFPPCWQKIQPPHFDYAGGSVIQEPDLRARATDLATAAVDALPRTRGLIGVDIVLGEALDGSADFAIEVNPRLTTSYVGLRCVSDQNLAHAMLAASIGEAVDLSFRQDRLEFLATGKVRRHDRTAFQN